METQEHRSGPAQGGGERQSLRQRIGWSSGTNAVAGVWLLFAPFALGYGDVGAAVANAITVGVLLLAFGWYRAARPANAPGLSWTNAVLGVWLLFAPFALGYGGVSAAVGNDIVVGLVALTLGAVSASAGQKLSVAH